MKATNITGRPTAQPGIRLLTGQQSQDPRQRIQLTSAYSLYILNLQMQVTVFI